MSLVYYLLKSILPNQILIMTLPPDKNHKIVKFDPSSTSTIATRSRTVKTVEIAKSIQVKPNTDKKNSNNPPYKCNNCSNTFRERRLLIEHYSKEHFTNVEKTKFFINQKEYQDWYDINAEHFSSFFQKYSKSKETKSGNSDYNICRVVDKAHRCFAF